MARKDALGFDAETAGDDDLAVLGQSLADRLEQFLLGTVEEAAGVDDDGVGAIIARRQLIALGAELSDDALGID